MSENEKAPEKPATEETVPTDLTPEQEAELLIQTEFPEEDLPEEDQTPEDIYKDKEAGA